MAQAITIGEYSQLQLKSLFSTPNTPACMKAAEFLFDYAPEVLEINGVPSRHWVSFFDADALAFAYFNPSDKKIHYRSHAEIRKQRVRL